MGYLQTSPARPMTVVRDWGELPSNSRTGAECLSMKLVSSVLGRSGRWGMPEFDEFRDSPSWPAALDDLLESRIRDSPALQARPLCRRYTFLSRKRLEDFAPGRAPRMASLCPLSVNSGCGCVTFDALLDPCLLPQPLRYAVEFDTIIAAIGWRRTTSMIWPSSAVSSPRHNLMKIGADPCRESANP